MCLFCLFCIPEFYELCTRLFLFTRLYRDARSTKHKILAYSHVAFTYAKVGTVGGCPVLPARYLSNVNKYPHKCHARSSLHVCRDPAVHTDPRSKGSKQVIARAVEGWFQMCDVSGSPRCPPYLFLLLVCIEFRMCSFLQKG
jgi:hypothetical protein